MQVLFFENIDGFPIVLGNKTLCPVEVVGGYMLRDTDEDRDICNSRGINYSFKRLNEITIIDPNE